MLTGRGDDSAIMPRFYPFKSIREVARKNTLPLAFEEPALLNALVYTTAAAIYSETACHEHGVVALYSKGEAIRHLKCAIEEPRTEGLSTGNIYAVSLLLWCEVNKISCPDDVVGS